MFKHRPLKKALFGDALHETAFRVRTTSDKTLNTDNQIINY